MEAVAALGVAAAVGQFTEYAVTLVFETRKVYTTAEGSTEDVQTLATITTNLKELVDSLDMNKAQALGLQDLVSTCQNIARQILSAVDSLQVHGDKTAWKSFVVALRSVRKQGDIDKLRRVVGELQNSLTLRLQKFILDRQSKLLEGFRSLEDSVRQVDLDRAKELFAIKNSLLVAVGQISSDAKLHFDSVASYTKKLQKSQDVALVDIKEFSERLQGVRSAIDSAVSEAGRISQEQRCLQSLRFKEIKRRYGTIETAHKATFGWIFKESEPSRDDCSPGINFGQWLRSGDGYFWVEGKAGSGKSTLMKYICEDSQTLQLLDIWAKRAHKRLITAKHFFWHSGTPLQKSQEGLLRSLLFEILRACPELIHEIGERHFSENEDGESWSRQELFGVLERLTSCDLAVRFCFFVDGLDEYDGDREQLVDLLQSLLRIPDLKICLSSRPLPRFRDAFGMVPEATLRLQDLTRHDIRTYVNDKFSSNQYFRQIAVGHAGYSNLVESVVDRADGVFLWVFLVVKSLLEGITNRDLLSDLQQRLDDLPKTLEDFFQHMIDNIEEIYKKRAVQAFQIALTCPEPSLLSTYSVLDQIGEVNNQVSGDTSCIMTAQQLLEMAEDTERRLYARCQGLLNVTKSQDTSEIIFGRDRVDFLHRSVRDFLNTQEMQDMLRAYSHDSYNANLELCRAMVATIEILRRESSVWDGQSTSTHTEWADIELIQPLFFFAREIENRQPGSEDMTASHHLLDQAESILRTTKWRWRRKKLVFVGHAVEYDVAQYAQLRLDASPKMVLRQKERPLLDYALLPRQMRFHKEPLRSLAMVSMILGKEADPNVSYKDWTIWARLLRTTRPGAGVNSKYFFTEPDMYEILLLLIKHGADLDAVVERQVIRQKARPKLTGRAADFGKSAQHTVKVEARAYEWLRSGFSEEQFDILSEEAEIRLAAKRQCALM